ncbi:MarR family transcriptional regulator [Patulibacter brassicae]|uniref:MarR family transcriptional regulator n=1 Tax=Patulibacter brassicae TaxID=1705717 RepID=A0ABU4VP24_9ACTN|nr:MarR family transcriptional regulator [Patulibacter brassicae]MDX8153610.1 MarR family transcriptional regulator [Patulibacter brassicae]
MEPAAPEPPTAASGGARDAGPPYPRSDDGAPPSTGELIARISRWIHGRSRDRLAPFGTTPAAARALVVLLRTGESQRMGDLAERLRIVPRSVTTLVDDLEREGLVERRPDPDDRRSTRVHLTDAGRERGAAMLRARHEAADDLVAVLDEADRDELHRLLSLLDAAAHADWCRHGRRGPRRDDPAAG